MKTYLMGYRALREKRVASAEHSSFRLRQPVSVRELMWWFDGPLAERWKPYCLISSNCQHNSHELQLVLRNKERLDDVKKDFEVVLGAVQNDGLHLELASPELQNN